MNIKSFMFLFFLNNFINTSIKNKENFFCLKQLIKNNKIKNLDVSNERIFDLIIQLDIEQLNYLSEGKEEEKRFTKNQIQFLLENDTSLFYKINKEEKPGAFLKLIKYYIQELDFDNPILVSNIKNLKIKFLNYLSKEKNYLSKGKKETIFTKNQIKLLFKYNRKPIFEEYCKNTIYEENIESSGNFFELIKNHIQEINFYSYNENVQEFNIYNNESAASFFSYLNIKTLRNSPPFND